MRHGLSAVLVVLAFTGCDAGSGASGPPETRIACTAVRATASIHCRNAVITASGAPAVDRSGTALILTAQGVDVRVHTSDVVWSEDGISLKAAVENLAGQPIGTSDGSSPDPRGIRLVFVQPEADVAGSPAPAQVIAAPDAGVIAGRDSVTGPSQPYLIFKAVLDSGARSADAALRLTVPTGAPEATFALVVLAPVQHPQGWVRVAPEAPMIEVGRPINLEASIRDALGRETPTVAVTWSTTTPTVAEVTSDGAISGRTAGIAHVTATCDAPCRATPDTAQLAISTTESVTLAVQPKSRFGISRFIYGINFLTDDGPATAGSSPWYGATVPATATLNRIGGNRMSAYNWRTNFSNAGNDYRFQNDGYISTSPVPAEAITRRVEIAMGRGAANLVTIPMLPFVAANNLAVPLDTTGATRAERLKAHFVPNRPSPRTGDAEGTIYQDQFVQFVDSVFPAARTDSARPIFFSLDNEPDIWHATHRAIMSDTLGRPRYETYDGFIETSVGFARAAKAVRPSSLIFGPAVATYAGVMTLGQYPTSDPVHGKSPFFEIYLDKMHDAEKAGGHRLLDVLDLHFYPATGTDAGEITNDWAKQDDEMAEKRVQAPRSLWDPRYDEKSWVSDVTGGPIALIPRLRGMIAGHYPGTRIAITEYYYGRGGDISGGLAQADALGIFGREGVFAASLWPQAGVDTYGNSGERAYAYAFGAFRLFRDFDGAGGAFGDVGLGAFSSDPSKASIYASRRADGRVVLVVINKSRREMLANIPMTSGPQPRGAQVYTMREGAPSPVRGAEITPSAAGYLSFTMPARSASTLLLEP